MFKLLPLLEVSFHNRVVRQEGFPVELLTPELRILLGFGQVPEMKKIDESLMNNFTAFVS